MTVKSGNALRRNWRGTRRPMKGLRNGHHTVRRRTHSPEHPCGSITASVRGCPRGVALIGSVSNVEIETPMALIYKALSPSLSTFETLPCAAVEEEHQRHQEHRQ